MIRTPAKLKGVCGIYGVIHRDSGRVYVGQSRNIGVRRNKHRHAVKEGSQSHFYCALRKYGEEAFDFEILEYCESEVLTAREQFYIRLMDAVKNGFNLAPNPSRSRWGVKASDETRAKISKALTGKKRKPLSEDHLAKIRQRAKDRVFTPAQRAKLSARFKGVAMDSEMVRRRGLTQRKPILQLDAFRNPIRVFASPIDAARSLKCQPQTITSAANGSYPRARGFKWAYLNS